MTALVTPLQSDAIDTGALARLLDRQIAAGVSAVLIGGGTGEFGALAKEERQDLAGEVAAVLDGRLPFVVQTGALATRDTIALSTHAEKIGALGILVASPFGEPINWREREWFYRQVSQATSLPIMVYNTAPAGLLSAGEIEHLAELPNITAVKDSSGDITLLGDLLAWSAAREFSVYVGWDSLFPIGIARGAHGALVGSGNIVPDEIVRTIRLCQRGDLGEEFDGLWKPLRALLRFMERSPNYIALCKHGLRVAGLDVGDVRAPYLMPLEDEQKAYAECLHAVQQAFESVPAAAAV